jgi:hypothetical protein
VAAGGGAHRHDLHADQTLAVKVGQHLHPILVGGGPDLDEA